jgi:predicted small secreted protein
LFHRKSFLVEFKKDYTLMIAKKLTTGAALILTVFALSACGNTIRGVGKDAASTVNATQAAGQSVESAAN